MKSISAVVPVYNEEKTIKHVLNVLSNSKLFAEIICVNDGSSDSSVSEINKIKDIKLVNNVMNKGKGYSLGVGIEHAQSEYVLMIDADLSTLNVEHINSMVVALAHFDAVVAYEEGDFLSVFSGQRIYKRDDLLPFISQIKACTYGVELLLNTIFKDKKVVYLKLNGLGHIDKLEKYATKTAVSLYVSQWFVEIMGHVMRLGISAENTQNILSELSKYFKTKIDKYNKKSNVTSS